MAQLTLALSILADDVMGVETPIEEPNILQKLFYRIRAALT